MKTFIRSLTGLVIIVILAAIIILFLAWSRVPDLVAGNLSKKLKVLVEIGDIDLSLRSIDVEKLEIGNPRGFYLPRAFAADRILIEAPLSRYLKDNIEIEEIDIDNVYLGLEFDSPQSTNGNWTAIMANAKAAQASNTNSSAEKSNRTVFIRRIVLTNIQTDLLWRSQGTKVRRLPTIKRMELKNISSEGGSVIDQITNSALGEMLKEVFVQQNLKDMLDKLFQPGGNSPTQQGLELFRGLLNAVPQKEPLDKAAG